MPAKNQTKYSIEDATKFAAKYWELGSAIKAGKELGVDPYFVRSAVKRIGRNPRDYAVHAAIMKREVTPEIESEILNDFHSGLTHKTLAEKYGISKSGVRECMDRNGLKYQRRGPTQKATEEQKEEVKRLFDEKMSLAKIEKITGLNVKAVRTILHEHGIVHIPRRRLKDRIVTPSGYALIFIDKKDPLFSMTQSGVYALEHRIVMARHLGRLLENHETVHHINGNKGDNRVENLQLISGKHGKGVVHQCACCGSFNIKSTEIKSDAQNSIVQNFV